MIGRKAVGTLQEDIKGIVDLSAQWVAVEIRMGVGEASGRYLFLFSNGARFMFERKKSANNITDRLLLKAIYEEYYSDFCSFDEENKSRASKNHITIDCKVISSKLYIDHDIVFGRLYYHLEKKYGYKKGDRNVPLFTSGVGTHRLIVNFPLLSAVLAELEQHHVRFTLPLWLSIVAIALSAFALIIQVASQPREYPSPVPSVSISQLARTV